MESEIDDTQREERGSSLLQLPNIRCDDNTFDKFQHLLRNFWENRKVVIIMGVLTVWSLFNDDIRIITAPEKADIAFTIIISIVFFIFVLEMLSILCYKKEYFLLPDCSVGQREERSIPAFLREKLRLGSFSFWIDLIATTSLLLEVGVSTSKYHL